MSSAGLEGVVAAETRLSHVDGELGRLVVAGHDVERLAPHASFEEAAQLLLGGDAKTLQRDLADGRALAFQKLAPVRPALGARDAMDALRGAIAQLPGDASPALVIASVATYAAAWSRLKKGKEPVPPSNASHAADLLRMIRGDEPSAAEVRAFETYVITVMDHGMNASTFTARIIASTGSDLVSAVSGAIGALKGPLHGGAPGPVLGMLDAIGEPSHARAFIEGELNAKRRIMGMGHRIYRVRDPRAAVLEQAIDRLEAAGVASGRLALARATERAAEDALARRHPDRPLKANVEFYTAVVLDAVRVPRQLFSAVFASARVVGWCAHVAEQRETGRLIRPASRYIGPMPV